MRPFIAFAAALALAAPACAAPGDVVLTEDSEQADFRLVSVAEGLEQPWALAFLPNGDMLVTEKPGRLRIIRDGALDPRAIETGLAIMAVNQGGLLDVSLHPDFASNNLVYLSFATGPRDRPHTALARGRLQGGSLQGVETIFDADHHTQRGGHFGGRIVWNPDGTLFLTIGDGWGYMEEAQSTANHIGTIVRLTEDGAAAAGNPFEGDPDARDEIWSYGHRNPQGAARQPGTNQLWVSEHGARGGDEVNRPMPGANYGWPAATFGIDYDGSLISEHDRLPGVTPPVIYWLPSIAPSGLAFYDGEAFPKWRGDLFGGALAGRHLRRMEIEGDRVLHQEELLEELEERIRDVRMGPDGFLYVVTDSGEGRVLRLEPR